VLGKLSSALLGFILAKNKFLAQFIQMIYNIERLKY
jgi:hypothetical protein